jgi:hypothetical protein
METQTSIQPIYLSKIVAGALGLCVVIFTAYWIPDAGLSSGAKNLLAAGLGVLVMGVVPLFHSIYRRCDEMLRRQHERAASNAIVWCVALCGSVGVGQAAELLPAFNQFWTMGLAIALWAVHLVWADVQNKA